MLGHGIPRWFSGQVPCPYNVRICAAFSAVNSPSEQRFDSFEQRLWFQHHAFAAAERAVVHGAMAVVRVFTQVVHAHVHQMRFARPPHDSIIERTAKKIRKNSYDFELHSWHSVPQLDSAAIQIPQSIGKRNIDALGLYVDSNAELRSQRHQHFTLARLYCQQRDASREFDIANRAHRRSGPCFPHFASNQLADVIVSWIELRSLLQRYLYFASAQPLGGFHSFNANKMKDGLPATARRKPASLNLHAPGCAPAIGEPHFA